MGLSRLHLDGNFMSTLFPHIVSAETIWPYVLLPLITVHKCAENIQGRKLFKGGNYMRKYGMYLLLNSNFPVLNLNKVQDREGTH